MLTALLSILVFALVLWIVYYLIGLFLKGTPHNIVGIILGLFLLIFALQKLGFKL